MQRPKKSDNNETHICFIEYENKKDDEVALGFIEQDDNDGYQTHEVMLDDQRDGYDGQPYISEV